MLGEEHRVERQVGEQGLRASKARTSWKPISEGGEPSGPFLAGWPVAPFLGVLLLSAFGLETTCG